MPLPQASVKQGPAASSTTAAPGLSRTRSLRLPQATGLPGAASTTTSRMPTKLAAAAAPAKSTLPTRQPSKLARAIPSAPSRTRSATTSAASTTSSSTTSKTTRPPLLSRMPRTGPSAPPPAPDPGTATLRRPVSGGRPSSSDGSPGGARAAAPAPTATAAATSARGHARTKSTSAMTALSSATASAAASTPPTSPTRIRRTNSTRQPANAPARPARNPLAAAPVLRPLSAQSAQSTQSVQSSSGGSSAGTRLAVTTRAAAARAPNRAPKEAAATATATAATTAAASSGAPGRPAFNTLQQHYSPVKNAAPKPRVAAILAPPASPSKKPANVALSAETSRLQTHLLQLHLLHRDAADVEAAWHASARHVLLDVRFAALAADHAELAQIAARRAESANAAALHAWATFRGGDGDDNGMTLEEKIQALDEVLAGVWSLAGDHSSQSAASSRYAQVVRRFERWAQQTAAQVEARQGITSLSDMDDLDDLDDGTDAAARFLANEQEPLLDASWHDECAQLARRLQGWQRQLGLLGRGVLDGATRDNSDVKTLKTLETEAQPSLVRLLAGCAGLVDGMLAELQAMQQLEREAAEQELAWVRRINAAAADDDTGKPRAGAIWRTV